MSEVPRFSIITPAYNASTTLAETVASVRAQTFGEWELLIVDDGSTDSTRALAEGLAAEDPRIRVSSQENRGPGGAYNTGVRAARSEWMVMLSADDLLLPPHLATLDAFLNVHADADVVTVGGFYGHPDGRRVLATPEAAWADPAGSTLAELLRECYYGVGAAYRKSVFDTVGGYREDTYSEDYLFWLLARAHGFTHLHIREPLTVHRRSATQMSANAVAMRENDVRVIELLIESGMLSEDDMAAARASVARLRRNIRIRKAAAALLGAKAERLIAGLRRVGRSD